MQQKKDILVVGAGKIGAVVADLLAGCGDYAVTLADRDAAALQNGAAHAGERLYDVLTLDVANEAALGRALGGRYAVLSAAPFHLTQRIAALARRQGVHYLDLTEDVASTRAIREVAHGADSALIPDSVRMRVGALPAYPSNALNYNLTWSTDGVINEYCEPCEAIVDGRRTEVPALEEREEFALDGVLYEAFNTSGGLGTLCETLEGKVRTLNYRTIRYPGHAAIMKALLNDLRLRDRRDVLKDILENAVPTTTQDVVIVFVTVAGWREGRLVQETYARKIYSALVGGQIRSAIQITTASSLAAMLDLLAEGKLPQRGFVRQEDVKLADFLGNRFGAVYAPQAQGH